MMAVLLLQDNKLWKPLTHDLPHSYDSKVVTFLKDYHFLPTPGYGKAAVGAGTWGRPSHQFRQRYSYLLQAAAMGLPRFDFSLLSFFDVIWAGVQPQLDSSPLRRWTELVPRLWLDRQPKPVWGRAARFVSPHDV